MLPTFIRSASEFQSVVLLGSTTESLVLEFKGTIHDWDSQRQEQKKEAQKETCRDIAQFANTLGGCLLIGVTERNDSKQILKVADSIAPVKDVEKLRHWIEQAVTNYLVPSTFTHDVVAILLPEGSILAVNVPPNRNVVSLWDRGNHTVEYVRRTSHGKDWMNPDEAERHTMDGSRAAKLAVVTAKEQAESNKVEIVGGLWRRSGSHINTPAQRWNPGGPITLGQIGEYWFELGVPTDKGGPFWVTIPYGLVKEAWVGASGVVTLLLSVRVIMADTKLILEPYV